MMSLSLFASALVDELKPIKFEGHADMVYNPLEYAWDNHQQYLERYGRGEKRVLFLGMNPGPWGMAQTGVPFGEIPAVRDWMKLDGKINKPIQEHPKRPIDGFDCHKSEVSGKRLWGYFSERYPDASAFFQDHFVVNFCPLVWMTETGANITPDKLPKAVMKPVEDACLRHLKMVISELSPEWLIGVGAFAEKRLISVAKEVGGNYRVGKILHPSPASPAANRGWAEAADRQLKDLGIF